MKIQENEYNEEICVEGHKYSSDFLELIPLGGVLCILLKST